MIIDNVRAATNDGRPAIAADVRWEVGPARTQQIYFATEARHAQELRLGGEPFLVACCLPAAHADGKWSALPIRIGLSIDVESSYGYPHGTARFDPHLGDVGLTRFLAYNVTEDVIFLPPLRALAGRSACRMAVESA